MQGRTLLTMQLLQDAAPAAAAAQAACVPVCRQTRRQSHLAAAPASGTDSSSLQPEADAVSPHYRERRGADKWQGSHSLSAASGSRKVHCRTLQRLMRIMRQLVEVMPA